MFIVNGVTVINNTKLCCICLEHKKTLLLSRCGHDVCVECYKKLIVEGKYSRSGEGMTCFLMLDQLVDSFVRQLMHIVAKKLLKMKLLKMQLIG